MKKKLNTKGFMLVETLIVTSFVAGVLIFLFVQFSTLEQKYETTYKYNNVEDLYSLKNIKNYLESDTTFIASLSSLTESSYLDITDCSNENLTYQKYCIKLFELENIERIYIVLNEFDKAMFDNKTSEFKDFINRVNKKGNQKYRIIAKFNNSTYATIRIG